MTIHLNFPLSDGHFSDSGETVECHASIPLRHFSCELCTESYYLPSLRDTQTQYGLLHTLLTTMFPQPPETMHDIKQ